MIARPHPLAAARPRLFAPLLGALSATGFAPLGLWPVTLLCFALFLILLGDTRKLSTALLIGYLFGLGHFIVGLNWIAHAFAFQDSMPKWLGYLAVVLLSFYLAVFPALATGLAWVLGKGRRDALTLAFAGSWAIAEYLRATLFTGFAWNPLGVMWLGTGVEQAARLIGTYGLGSLAILTAGALAGLAARRWSAAVPLALLAIIAAFGLHEERSGIMTRIPVTVVQPNVGQGDKYSIHLERANFLKLANLSLGDDSSGRLIFWPEGAVYAILDMEPNWRRALSNLLAPGQLLMTGGDKYRLGRRGELLGANNSLWVIDPDAHIRGRYDKAHLVPYGEYLPMRPILSAIGLSRLVPGDIDFWPGPGPHTLPLPAAPGRPALNMGVQICYEIIFSGQVVDEGHRPDFLFNPSNDAWFGTWGPPQHLAQARLRAVEEGIPVIRSTPTGISAIVDARGRLVAQMGEGRAAAIHGFLPAVAPVTLFARCGNILPMLLALLMMLSGVALARGRR